MKKITSMILVVIMVITMTTSVYADIKTETKLELTDTEGHWAKDNIEKLVSMGVINGYPDGTFRPDEPLLLQDLIVMISKALEFSDNVLEHYGCVDGEKKDFLISAGKQWWYPYAVMINDAGFIKHSDFENMGNVLTREKTAAIIYNILSKDTYTNVWGLLVEYKFPTGAGMTPVTDEERVIIRNKYNDLYVNDNGIFSVIKSGIITGHADGTFKPDSNLTRAEATTIILRLLDETLRKPIVISEEEINNVTASDKLPTPRIKVVYGEREWIVFRTYIDNIMEYIPKDELWTTAEFKIEFPELPELYYYEATIDGIGTKKIMQCGNEWRSLAEDQHIWSLTKDEYTTQNDKFKVAKIMVPGYKLKYKVTVKDTIDGVEVIKIVEDYITMEFEDKLSTDW